VNRPETDAARLDLAADQDPSHRSAAETLPADEPRVWTHVYVQFSLPQRDRNALDAALRAAGASLGQRFQDTLVRCLAEAGIDPARLTRPGR